GGVLVVCPHCWRGGRAGWGRLRWGTRPREGVRAGARGWGAARAAPAEVIAAAPQIRRIIESLRAAGDATPASEPPGRRIAGGFCSLKFMASCYLTDDESLGGGAPQA